MTGNNKGQGNTELNLDRLLLIGDGQKDARSHKFSESYNLSEFEYAIIRPKGLFDDLPYVDKTAHIEDYKQFNHVVQYVQKRISDFMEWIEQGGILVFVLEDAATLATFRYSSYEQFSIFDTAFFKGVKSNFKRGKLIELCPKYLEFADLANTLQSLSYQYILGLDGPVPFFRVSRSTSGKEEVVGAWTSRGRGMIIYAPPVDDNSRGKYYRALVQAAKLLRKSRDVTRPEWSSRFVLPTEKDLIANASEVRGRIGELQSQELALETRIECERGLKSLFFANDEEFVEAVKSALKELGFLVLNGPHPRADLIANIDNHIVAVEAKGLDGCAREVNLRQTDRWKSEVDAAKCSSGDDLRTDPDLPRYIDVLSELGVSIGEETSTPCKGLMIIGTYRKLPLDERKHPDFPPPLLQKIQVSKVCAVTGLQLLGLVLNARAQPTLRSQIVHALLETDGQLKLATDWTQFIAQD